MQPHEMSDILAKIEAYKRHEIEAAKAAVPPDHIRRQASEAAPPRSFVAAIGRHLSAGRPALIAEIKKASPSKGLIRADFDPPALARACAEGGARGFGPAYLTKRFSVRAVSSLRGAGLGRGLHPGHHGERHGCRGSGAGRDRAGPRHGRA